MEVLTKFTGEETLNKDFIPKLNTELGILNNNTQEVLQNLQGIQGDVQTLNSNLESTATRLSAEIQQKTKPMQGATASSNGKQGTVPAPKAGEQNSCLFGDGTYRKVAGLPVGFEYINFGKEVPTGSLPYFGGLFSRETYKDLWELVQSKNRVLSETAWQDMYKKQNGNVPFYSIGDNSTTFRVPCIKGYIAGANDVTSVGKYIPAGLPNITGNITGDDVVVPVEGAFKTLDTTSTGQHLESVRGNYYPITFDASLSNPIYGKSSTVTPETVQVMYCVVAFGAVTNVGEADVTAFANEVTAMNVRLNALEKIQPKRYIVETYHQGSEWYEKYNDGWIRQGGLLSQEYTGGYIWKHLNFIIPFKDLNYYLNARGNWQNSCDVLFKSRTTTGVEAYFAINREFKDFAYWYAEGRGV